MITGNDTPGNHPLETYKKRSGIEVLFAMLKRQGFDQEQTHLTTEDRVGKLIALLPLPRARGTSGIGRREVVLRYQTSPRRTISREGLTKPDYIGLTGVAEHDQPALHDDELHGDRIYSDQTLKDTLLAMVLRVRSYNY